MEDMGTGGRIRQDRNLYQTSYPQYKAMSVIGVGVLE